MKYTIAANDEAARELAERRKLAKQCAEFAFNKPCGSKAALKDDQFKGKGLTYNMVEPLLKELKAGPKKNARVNATRDHHKQILTNDERIQLGEWILACAAGQVPKDRTAVSSKVKEMLRARQASNKSRSWCGGSIALMCGLCRARGTAGSGARCAGPRRACAGPGLALLRASHCCWATTPLWGRRRGARRQPSRRMCGRHRPLGLGLI